MWVGFLIELIVGLSIIALGLLIWLKQKVNLLHDYHYQHVKPEDIPAYAKVIGIGLSIIGLGICVTGFLNLFESRQWWIPLVVGFIAGIIVMHRGQKKYNGSWFS
ncbi:MAG: DUF3784 domain-containing protein [Firmicutes bacterium]|nr:DUF3784 domain-containing protein [Bacillota bacterium]